MMFKVHPIRHIIIIAVIVVVLFPVLWIFTTSIRRDNSSISPDLFSGQTTWQNYIDLIFEKPNVPLLYNDIANIYSLGSPYNKMSDKEILNALNGDFNAYEGYFKSTYQMSNSITSNASWISVNFIPKAKSLAIESVKENSGADLRYISIVSSDLGAKFNSLDKNYKMAGLVDLLNSLKSSPDSDVIILGEYFPEITQSWNNYKDSMSKAASALSNVPGNVSEILLESGIDNQMAKDLVNAYEETLNSLKNGTFTYGNWFAPIYLRRINMDTINLSNTVGSTNAAKLQNIKSMVFSTVQNVNSAFSSYDQSLSNAISKAQVAKNLLLSTLQSSLTTLSNNYNSLQNQLSTMTASAVSYLGAMSYDASQISIFSNNIVPTAMALDNMVSLVKSIISQSKPSTQSGVFYDVSSYISQAKEWISISSKYSLFDPITKQVQRILDDLNYIQNNQSIIYANMNSNAIANVRTSLPFVLLKLQSGLSMSIPVLQNYDMNAQKYKNISEEIPNIRKQIAEISSQIGPIQQEINSINDKISISSLYFATLKYSRVIDREAKQINSFESAGAFLNDLNKYYSTLQNSNIYSQLPPMPSSSRYDQFFNTQKLIDTVNLTIQTGISLNKFTDQYSYYISHLKDRSKDYVNINVLGFPFSVNEINSINNLYQNQYVSTIGPNLGIISRRTNELAGLPYFKEISGKLGSINNTSYYITQIWMQKYIPPLMRWLLNSIIVSGSAAVITVFLSALMAYPFSRLRFRGRKYGLIGILLIQMFPTMMAMVALYLLLNFIGKFFPFLGLNTLGGLTFLYIGGGIAFNSWLIKGFFDTIPMELEEAAMVDGATRYQTFWRIILPLSAPVLAVTMILGFIGNYGDYILASIVMTGLNNYTFAVGLQTFSTGAYSTNWGLMTTAALIGMIPILVLFLSLQRFIVGGLTQGSVKG
ncbi:sugar ABC transporter permease [Athalassotoga saccharophila]|uniref:sugar ABC transporter permease n=1 Tax=Athalassotoga saccharophila TaxID=1441386 RepID=UPI001379F7BE|nr:ABC transporter permease subunit [Athalassotoga saccharophila]BBJ29020.1 maltodextrin ABC transporter, permease protein MdxG [Athalassotoga saccharophila]